MTVAMTMTEKILARGAGRESVRPGDLVLAQVDFAMGHDLTIPPAGKIMREQMGAEKIWDPDRVAVTQDHFQPAKDAASATLGRLTREFSHDMGIKWYFEVGQGGICHTVLPENGLVLPGELVVGADSHSCTYGALNNFATGIGSTDLACVLALGELWFRVPETLKFVYHNRLKEWVEAKDLILYVIGQIGVDGARSKAMEHTGEALKHIDMEARLTMTNMAIEAGAKNGIMEFDEVTKEYLDGRAKRPYTPVTSDRAGSAPDHHAVLTPGRDPGREGRLDPHVPRGRRCLDDRDVRRLPRRSHGRARRGRDLLEHHQPQLPRPHGPPQGAGLSLQSSGCRGERGYRRDHAPKRGARPHAGGDSMTLPKVIRGKAWKFGDNVDTDQIIPAKYAIYSLDEKELGKHAMEGVPGRDTWATGVTQGDILVGGSNFGCGSSREIAPVAIRGAGISLVVADSFARIFFRNAINMGYPILQSPPAAEGVEEGDELEVDLEEGIIRNFTKGDEYRCEAFPQFMNELLRMGGLVPWVRKQLEERRKMTPSRG